MENGETWGLAMACPKGWGIGSIVCGHCHLHLSNDDEIWGDLFFGNTSRLMEVNSTCESVFETDGDQHSK